MTVPIANNTYSSTVNLVISQGNVVWNYAPPKRNEDVQVERINDDRWKLTWDSDGGLYDIVSEGHLVDTDNDGSYIFFSNKEPSVEIYDVDNMYTPYTYENKPYTSLNWYQEDMFSALYALDGGSYHYKGRGVLIGLEDGYQEYNSNYLGDDLQEEWKIITLNSHDVASDEVKEHFPIISHPDAPIYSASVSSGSLIITGA